MQEASVQSDRDMILQKIKEVGVDIVNKQVTGTFVVATCFDLDFKSTGDSTHMS